jgi:hypothetical protein
MTIQIDGLGNHERIITPVQRQEHIARLSGSYSRAGRELVGDLAAVSCNQRHNPESGFEEWLADTPEWVKDIAIRRGWATMGTPVEESDL